MEGRVAAASKVPSATCSQTMGARVASIARQASSTTAELSAAASRKRVHTLRAPSDGLSTKA